jgi:hypothetical protein
MTFSFAAGRRTSQSEEQRLVAVDVLAFGKVGYGAGFAAMLHQGLDVEAMAVVDSPVPFDNRDDLESHARHEPRRHAADVAEALE